MNLEQLSDKELMHMMGNRKKEKAFSILYNRYYPGLCRFLNYKLENNFYSDDLSQETFVKLFRSYATFKFEENASFKTWLYRIAINTLRDYHRKERRLKLKEESFSTFFHASTSQKTIEKREKDAFFIDCCEELRKLDAQSYDLLGLIYFKEYSYKQISNEMKIPMGTVKSEIYRAKSRLKKLFLNHNKISF